MKRVAAGDGERHHPQRDHRREVERRNADDDAERLEDDVAVHVARDVGQRPAHEQRRDAAGELDDVDAAAQRAARLAEQLAVLADDQPRRGRRSALRAARGSGRGRGPGRAAASLARRGRPPPRAAQASSTCSGDASRTAATSSRRCRRGCRWCGGRGPSPATQRPPIRFRPRWLSLVSFARGMSLTCCPSTVSFAEILKLTPG